MKKIWRLVLATIFVIAGVFVAASPANAVTADCFPGNCSGWYSDTQSHARGGWDAEPSGFVGGYIQWYSDHIQVSGNLQDVSADGNGPYLEFQICPGGNYDCYFRDWHWTEGAGTSHHYNSYFYPAEITDGTSIFLMMCNGVSAQGYGQNCTPQHGPFHRY